MTKIPLTIRVESCDLESWQRTATKAGLTLSEWLRRTANADVPGSNPGRVDSAREPRFGKRAAEASVSHQCIHKKERGELCYKCDPKFGNPEIA